MTPAETRTDRLGLFEGFGVEIELAIVDTGSGAVAPVSDWLLSAAAGRPTADVDRGSMEWSNELVLHVLEIKTNGPVPGLAGLSERFHAEVRAANDLLAQRGARLLGGGVHPWMNPAVETRIWPHQHNEVYSLYDRIFGCRGHGWSNLQSTHLNLSFQGDDEFGRLHAAVRLVLPILPALSAASPFLDGRFGGFLDARLEAYRHNQASIPSLTGVVIPERAFTRDEYQQLIFDPLIRDIEPHDHEGVLDRHFLNSRGAIARFDRGSIEIRVLDAQECPAGDVAILELVVAVLRGLVEERWSTTADQRRPGERDLAELFLECVRDADRAPVVEPSYLRLFDLRGDASALAVWRQLADRVGTDLSSEGGRALETVLSRGPLARRMLEAVGPAPAATRLERLTADMAACLHENRLYV